MVAICFMALSLDIILVGEILKYRYTACIPTKLFGLRRCVYACVYSQVLLAQIEPTCDAWAWAKHFMGVIKSFYGCGFRFVRYLEAILYQKVTLGVRVLSAVWNQEESASRRLL